MFVSFQPNVVGICCILPWKVFSHYNDIDDDAWCIFVVGGDDVGNPPLPSNSFCSCSSRLPQQRTLPYSALHLANTNTAVLQNGVGSMVVVHQLSRQRTRSCLRPSPIPLLLLLLLHHQHFCCSAVYSCPKRFLTLKFCTSVKEWR